MAAYDLNAKGSGNEVHAIRVRGSLYIDVLKILAALAVVILHTNAIFWEGPSSPAWLSANLIETLFYWAAPMFFMISGATLLNYPLRMSTKKYVVKRIRKTVVPYCLWTVIAILFFTVGPYRVMRPDLSIREIVKAFVRPGASPYTLPVYWYFPALFGVYIAIPFIASMKYEHVRGLAFVLVLFQSLLPTFATVSGVQFINTDFAGSLSIGYSLLAVLGYVLSKEEISGRWRGMLYLLGILSWGAEFFGTLAVSNTADGVVRTFKGYLSFFCIVQTSAVFVFTKYACSRLEDCWPADAVRSWKQRLSKIASLTFGVYLIHYYFTIYLPMTLPIDRYSLGWRIWGGVAIFAVCSVITALLAKVPVVNKMLLGK